MARLAAEREQDGPEKKEQEERVEDPTEGEEEEAEDEKCRHSLHTSP